MARKKLVLMVSDRMDSNKKEGRDENTLIRMSATSRDYMGFHNDKVELWPGEKDRTDNSIMLAVFHAFKTDITQLKEKNLSEDKYKRVGFVTTKTFNRIYGGKKANSGNIWISDDVDDNVLGTDPEFLLIQKTGAFSVVNAENLLGKAGDFGGDGAMCEIRPKPESSVVQLVKNMKSIFKEYKDHERAGQYKWIATCFHNDGERGYPVGGHIHVGNPKQLMEKSQDVRNKFYKVLNKIMDEYLALPFVKLDGPNGKLRRKPGTAPMGPFGFYGGLRTDLGRLEHRTLSGVWIIHPSVSRAVLGTAKAVVDETLKLASDHGFKSSYILPSDINKSNIWDKEFDKWNEVPIVNDMRATTSSGEMIDILNERDHTYWTLKRIGDLYNKLKNMSTYKENSRFVDGFIEILKIKYNEFKKFDAHIQKNWLTEKKFIVTV